MNVPERREEEAVLTEVALEEALKEGVPETGKASVTDLILEKKTCRSEYRK